MSRTEQQLKALDCFKDWSNYMLVTTVAALGWVTVKGESLIGQGYIAVVVILLVLSTAAGIFTLAMIPIVAEKISEETHSFFEIDGQYKPLWLWGPVCKARIKWFCWPQHFLFIAGLCVYAAGVLTGE